MKAPHPSPATASKRGRKSMHYRTTWGEVVNGLARRPSDGRWRVIGSPITFTESDERLAIDKYRRLYAKDRQRETIAIPFAAAKSGDTQDLRHNLQYHLKAQQPPSDPAEAFAHAFVPQPFPEAGDSTRVELNSGRLELFGRDVDGAAFWPWLRRLILDQRELVAERTGIAWLRWGPDMKDPGPSPTLTEIGKLYLDGAKISDNWRAKCKGFWNEFVDAVEVKDLRDITQEQIVDYGDLIHEAAETPTYSRQRFGAIKAIINYPTKRGKWAEDCKRVLVLCAVLVPPSKSATNPNPISPADFKKLLANADDVMKATLLLGLNCCMYCGEVAAIDWSEFDLDKRTLVTSRNKTKVIRIATLWPRTVAALRKLPCKTGAVFLTEAGTQADYLSVYRLFKTVRKAAGLEGIQFSQIRDGAYTAAVEAGIDLDTCRLLAGHATGISDHYVKRRPAMVAAACQAIERAYF